MIAFLKNNLIFFKALKFQFALKKIYTRVKLKNCTDSAIGLIVDSHKPSNIKRVDLVSFANSKNDLVPYETSHLRFKIKIF